MEMSNKKSYQVLARRFRPQTFGDVVGQLHVWKVLKNAIAANRLAHAYVFAGPRGTGKTTTARIFSKALNCELKKDEPCGSCPFCREIMDGVSVDVLEIDGASNRGIDEIRALRENVKYAPARMKYKIYIIDEAHQITGHAFDALLKTLEEPPAHVIFILATTEMHNIPQTILSRCQQFRFRPLSVVEISENLKKIIKTENFKVNETAAGLISMAAGGSIRDSLSILDQIISFSPDTEITAETVRELLGLTPVEMVESLFELAAKNDARGVIKKITEVADEGYDFIQVSRDLRDRIRNLLVLNHLGDEKEIGEYFLQAEIESLKKQKNLLDTEGLMRGFHLMNRCLDEIKWSDAPRLVFELYALKFASGAPAIGELIRKVEEIEEALGSRPSIAGAPAPSGGQSGAKRIPPGSGKTAEPSGQTISQPEFDISWKKALEEIRKKKPLVPGFLETCIDKKISDGNMVISIGEGLGVETIKRNLNVIEPAFSNAFSMPLKIQIDLRSVVPVSKPEGNQNTIPEEEAVDEEITIAEEIPDEEKIAVAVEKHEIASNKAAGNGSYQPAADEIMKKILKTFAGKILKDVPTEKNTAPDRSSP